jgi:hypothetical protein
MCSAHGRNPQCLSSRGGSHCPGLELINATYLVRQPMRCATLNHLQREFPGLYLLIVIVHIPSQPTVGPEIVDRHIRNLRPRMCLLIHWNLWMTFSRPTIVGAMTVYLSLVCVVYHATNISSKCEDRAAKDPLHVSSSSHSANKTARLAFTHREADGGYSEGHHGNQPLRATFRANNNNIYLVKPSRGAAGYTEADACAWRYANPSSRIFNPLQTQLVCPLQVMTLASPEDPSKQCRQDLVVSPKLHLGLLSFLNLPKSSLTFRAAVETSFRSTQRIPRSTTKHSCIKIRYDSGLRG